MAAFLIGECGRTELEAAQTTFTELRALSRAHEARERREWERLRWQEWHQTMLSPYIKPVNKPRTPKAMMPFAWETPDNMEAPKGCEVTPEITELMADIFEKLKARNNG